MNDDRAERPQPAGSFKDARGKPITLLDPYLLHKLCRYDLIPPEPLADIARNIGSGWAKAGRVIFSIVWPAVLVCMAIAHWGKWGGGFTVQPRELRLWLILLALLTVNIALVWILSRSGRLASVCRVMLEHLRCPHCGYDIRGLPRDPEDGITVCPECGSAWRLGDTQPSVRR